MKLYASMNGGLLTLQTWPNKRTKNHNNSCGENGKSYPLHLQLFEVSDQSSLLLGKVAMVVDAIAFQNSDDYCGLCNLDVSAHVPNL